MSKNRILHVIDGSGYIYRAYYAIRALSTGTGEPTNAVYGFTTMLQKLLREERPDYVAIAFDPDREHSIRRKWYPEYKANRKPPPEDLTPQIPRILEIVESFRIPQLQHPEYEADDVIATLVKKAVAAGCDVRVITGDKDLMQLVSDRVTVWEPVREKRFTPKDVIEKYGVPPEQIVHWLALSGDSSDNIPGVRGVGPKGAAKLLTAHGDVAGVVAAAKEGKVKGKLGEKIAAAEEDAMISLKLCTLVDTVPLEMDLEAMLYEGPDQARQQALFTELEFGRLLTRSEDEAPAAPKRVAPSRTLDKSGYRAITDADALNEVVDKLSRAGRIALSLEHSSSHIIDATIHGFAIAEGPGDSYYFPFGHNYPDCPPQLSIETVLAALKPVLEDGGTEKICSSAKVWYALCALHDIELRSVVFDTSIASYLYDAEDRYDSSSSINHGADDGPHGVGDVARKFLSTKTTPRSAVTGRGRDRIAFEAVTVEAARDFVGERADVTYRAYGAQTKDLAEAELTNVLTDLELPLAPVIASVENKGIRVDLDLLAEMKTDFAAEIKRIEESCYEAAGKKFKIGSPKQLREILFDDLGLKIIKRTKTGPSTDSSVLEELSGAHPLPKMILEYRQVTKLKSTYIDALPKQISPTSGRVHTSLSQIVAATGRLSSTDPNLQNIPIRTELGRQLRKAFLPKEGSKLISVDYSQIELRVLAHFTQEKVLVDAFVNEEDIHTRTASVLMDVPPDEVTREQRTQAKAVNFGVLYGMGPVRLARQLDLERRVASKFIKDYFARQPAVRDFIDATLTGARETGYVRTLLGRRRWVRDINSKSRGSRAAAERVATNTPIQGSAADLIKLAMIRVAGRLAAEHPKASLLLQVHDELLLEAPDAEADEVAALVKREMESAFPLAVPLVAEAHVGNNWDEAH